MAGPPGCPWTVAAWTGGVGDHSGTRQPRGRTSGAWPGRKVGPACTPPWAQPHPTCHVPLTCFPWSSRVTYIGEQVENVNGNDKEPVGPAGTDSVTKPMRRGQVAHTGARPEHGPRRHCGRKPAGRPSDRSHTEPCTPSLGPGDRRPPVPAPGSGAPTATRAGRGEPHAYPASQPSQRSKRSSRSLWPQTSQKVGSSSSAALALCTGIWRQTAPRSRGRRGARPGARPLRTGRAAPGGHPSSVGPDIRSPGRTRTSRSRPFRGSRPRRKHSDPMERLRSTARWTWPGDGHRTPHRTADTVAVTGCSPQAAPSCRNSRHRADTETRAPKGDSHSCAPGTPSQVFPGASTQSDPRSSADKPSADAGGLCPLPTSCQPTTGVQPRN